ncbi:hypothetical protein Scep_006379 [Stephania cephalantha]|uniref:Uncharacterized protein n=1 Tax=Stephania cephalantha TaxID=152367 RepID=A0AAP0PKS2_9MAGN
MYSCRYIWPEHGAYTELPSQTSHAIRHPVAFPVHMLDLHLPMVIKKLEYLR